MFGLRRQGTNTVLLGVRHHPELETCIRALLQGPWTLNLCRGWGRIQTRIHPKMQHVLAGGEEKITPAVHKELNVGKHWA